MHATLFYVIAVLLTTVYSHDSLDDNLDTVFDSKITQIRSVESTSSTSVTLNIKENTPPIEEQTGSAVSTSSTQATPRNRSCGLDKECVLFSLCSPKDALLIDLHVVPDDEDCPFFTETCCYIDDIEHMTEPTELPNDRSTGCGYRNVDGVGFKIDEELGFSPFGEFPWMLAIMDVTNNTGEDAPRYYCGGSLIHPRVALTGGYCVYNKSADTMIVRAGEWDLNSNTEIYPHQDRQVVDIVIHEEYKNNNLRYNIALLFMDSPFELAPNVNTACLPPAAYDFNAARCYSFGWGATVQNGEFSKLLKKVDLPIVPRNECQNLLRQTRLGRYFELHSTFFCAGGEEGKDTCKGDGGSPLVCPIEKTENRYYQTGIVSWGIGCFKENIPSVYTNVAMLRPWIDDKLANKEISSSYYTA